MWSYKLPLNSNDSIYNFYVQHKQILVKPLSASSDLVKNMTS